MDDLLLIVTSGRAKIETIFTKKSNPSLGRTFLLGMAPAITFIVNACQI